MERVLVIVRVALDADRDHDRVRARCASDHEIAVCCVLPPGQSSLADVLQAQRATTASLRRLLGSAAERVAVFAASDREDDGVEACARAWGATVVDV